MAFSAFLKVDGVPGESQESKHKEWIEILSFSHGVSQESSGVQSTGGSRTKGRSDHQDFQIVKVLDKTSPKLNLMCCQGTHIKEVKIELWRAGGKDPIKYMEYKMEDVLITGVRPGGNCQGSETLPLEEVSFNYGKINWVYTATDHKTGKSLGDVKADWSTVENKGQ
jgi:type VI secretion system secreted protein Hcp